MNYQLKKNTWFVVLLILMVTVMAFYSPDKVVNAQNKPELKKMNYLDKELEKVIIDKKAVGMIAAVISSDGIIEIGSAGVRKAGTSMAMTDKDHVHLGSCAKAMTATMIATLVAEGKLSWDTKLIEAIPEMKNKIHADYHKITLWKLLTHSAGIPKNSIDSDSHNSKEITKRRLAIIEDNLKSPATYEIDEFNYSNFGYVIAACMAEQITGLSWEVLIKERLFDPLGMTTAGIGDPIDPLKKKSIDQPWGHKRSWLGNKWKPSRAYYGEVISPAGRIHCSIEDWAKFISLQLPGDNTFLDRTILNKLIEPVGFYAAGWVVLKEAEQPWAKGIVLVHGGSNEIWYAAVMVAPAIDRAYVVVTNSCDFGVTDRICVEMTNKVAKMDQNL